MSRSKEPIISLFLSLIVFLLSLSASLSLSLEVRCTAVADDMHASSDAIATAPEASATGNGALHVDAEPPFHFDWPTMFNNDGSYHITSHHITCMRD